MNCSSVYRFSMLNLCARGQNPDRSATQKQVDVGQITIRSRVFSIAISLSLITYPLTSYSACNIVAGKAYGDCSGVNVNDQAQRNLIVTSSVTESSIVAGATIYRGGSLTLAGMSTGDIYVKRGGVLTVYGIVSGTVNNDGGHVDIEGIVNHLHSAGGHVLVTGQLGGFSGKGPVLLKKDSILQSELILQDRLLAKPK